MNGTEGRPAFWRSRIGRRLLLAILCFSSLITLVVALSDLYIEYSAGVATIRDRLRQVEISYAASLGESLWKLDKRQIALQLRGIAELPDIRTVELHESNAVVPIRFSISVEDDSDGPGDSRDIPVWCNCGGTLRTIGILHVEATHANLYRNIFHRAEVILAGQAVKTFLVATFILFVVHHMVTRHLLDLAGAIAGFTPGETARLSLRRSRGRPDEFDEVVDTFNAMGERLERRGADLRAADARMQAILDNIPDLVWFKDADGRFIAGNRPLAQLLGVDSPAALVGRRDEDFSPPDLARAYRADDSEVIRTRTAKRIEELHVRQESESRFLIETVKTPLYDGDGAVIGTVGIARDISARRAMEEELRETATRLEALIANLKATVFRSTYSAAGPRLSVSFYGVSEVSGRAVLAVAPLELKDFRRTLHPEDQARELDTLGQEFAELGYVNRPCRTIGSDGSTRWHMVRERVVGRDGDLITTEGLSVDVSEEMETRRMLEAVISNLPGSVFRLKYDADGNKRRLFMQGGSFYRRPVEIDTVIPQELYHPDDRHMLFVELPARLKEMGTAVHTFRTLHPDGGYRWLRAWERVVQRDGDEIITEGITLDVTEEIEAKRLLEKSERHLSDLVAALPVGVFETDASGEGVFVSSLWTTLTGLPATELLGNGWRPIISPNDLAAVERYWAACVAEHTFFQAEFRLRHVASGRETWVLSRAQPRLDDDGNLLGFIGSITDISDRKVYEGSLERLNHVLRMVTAGNEALMQASDKATLFASVCQVVIKVGGYRLAWIGLAEHDEPHTIRPVAWAGDESDYAAGLRVRWDESTLGCGPTGTAVRTGLPYVAHDIGSDPGMAPWRDEALRHGFRSTVSLPLKGEAAVIGCLNIYSSEIDSFTDEEARILLDFANNIAFTVVALRERRRREEVERHLQQAQKMEALGLLAGSVAHDFNNLLGAIQGFAGFIVEDSPEDDSASYYGQRILMAGKRGKALIGQILSFSRQIGRKREVFAVGDLIAETKALLETSLPASTQLAINGDVGGTTVTGDRDLLGQALINLCMNANDALGGTPGIVSIIAHAHPSGDGVTARLPAARGVEPVVWQDADGLAHAVTGSLDPSQPCVSLVVSDSGCGMDKAVLGKIFVPFFTTKTKDHGTGLGLAAVQRTVLAHDGLILVESRPGCGASFEIILPCAVGAAAVAAADRPARHHPAAAAGRILLVDDDADFGDMLLTALERRGYDVSPCADPVEALAGLKDFPGAWDAMITDQTMPNMSGLELIRSAKSLQPDLACILCTGFAEDALDEVTLAEAGAVALFRKPVDVDDLVDTLNRLIPS